MIKDIMVHLDGSPEDEIRLEHGQAIASTGRAHLIGIFTNLLPDLTVAMPIDSGGAVVMQALAKLEERARGDGDATAQRLTERLVSLQVPSELRRFDGSAGALCTTVAEQARCADLFIATRPYAKTGPLQWDDLVEAVLFGSGHALLVVPPGCHRKGPIETVLVAWDGSREAARAVDEGLRFMEQAARTIVLVVDPEPQSTAPTLTDYLARHGVTAGPLTIESQGRSTGDVILDEARRVAVDLVIMGGYGHTRLRERVFGGATLDMLTASETPMLMAH